MRFPLNIYYWEVDGWHFGIVFFLCCFGIQYAAQTYMAVDGFVFVTVYTANGALKQLEQKLINLRTIQTKGIECFPFSIYFKVKIK